MTERRDCISPAIIEAAANNNTKEVLRLLEYGHCPNTRAYDAVTPLMLAAMHGNAKMILALIRHGADIHATDCDGWNAHKWAKHCNESRVFHACLLYPEFMAQQSEAN